MRGQRQELVLLGETLAEIDGRFCDDFRPATFHLSVGQRAGRRAKWFLDQTEEEASSLLRAVRNLESYLVLDEYLASLRVTKEETLTGQEFAHVTVSEAVRPGSRVAAQRGHSRQQHTHAGRLHGF